MSKPDQASEPSMDEILSSIRKIIAEEPIGSRPDPEVPVPAPVEAIAEKPEPAGEPAGEPAAEPVAELSAFDALVAVSANIGRRPAPSAPMPDPAAAVDPPAPELEMPTPVMQRAPAPAPVMQPAPVPEFAAQPVPVPMPQPAPVPDPAAATGKPDTLSDDLMDLIAEVQEVSPNEKARLNIAQPAPATGPDQTGIPSADADDMGINSGPGPSAFSPAKPAVETAASLGDRDPQASAAEVDTGDPAVLVPPNGAVPGIAPQSEEAAVELPEEPADAIAAETESETAAVIVMPPPVEKGSIDAGDASAEPAPEDAAPAADAASDPAIADLPPADAAPVADEVAATPAPEDIVADAAPPKDEPAAPAGDSAATAAAAPIVLAASLASLDVPVFSGDAKPESAANGALADAAPIPASAPQVETAPQGEDAAGVGTEPVATEPTASDQASAEIASGAPDGQPPEVGDIAPVDAEAAGQDGVGEVAPVTQAAEQSQAGAGALVTSRDASGAVVRTLEDTVSELLRPMLREWLDANMPRIVEKSLKIELARSVATDLEGKEPE